MRCGNRESQKSISGRFDAIRESGAVVAYPRCSVGRLEWVSVCDFNHLIKYANGMANTKRRVDEKAKSSVGG